MKFLSYILMTLMVVLPANAGGPSPFHLAMSGPITSSGVQLHFEVTNAPSPGMSYVQVIGLSTVNVPFGGTVLVPALDFSYSRPTNGSGFDQYTLTYGPGIPSGTPFYFQALQKDPGGIWQGTNAILLTVP